MVWRWSLVTGVIIAAFWTIYSIFGDVPSVTNIKMMNKSWTIPLPFTISRWWDIVIGPLWSTFFVLFLTSKARKSECLDAGLVFGLIFGLDFGLVFGLFFGLVFGLTSGLVTIIKMVVRARFWSNFRDWMMVVKEKPS